jgi:hypothetical protein
VRTNQVALDNPIPASWANDERGAQGGERPRAALEVAERQVAERALVGGILRCMACGEQVTADTPDHPVETRIVKPKNNYGGARELSVVYIEPRHMDDNAKSATMSVDHLRMIEARIRQPVAQEKPLLLQAVEAALPAMQRQTQEQIRSGRERAARDAQREADRARDLLEPRSASDLEPTSQPIAPVADESRLDRLERENQELRERLDRLAAGK